MTRARGAIVVGVAVSLAVIGWIGGPSVNAQGTTAQPPPIRIRVQVTEVKPDMVQQYQDLARTEAIPAQKKAGMAWRWTWRDGGPFGENSMFYTIQPVTNFAQFDQPNALTRGMGAEAAAKHQAKVAATIVSSHAWIDTVDPNNRIESGSKTPPAMAIVETWQTLPGKAQEFLELLRTEYLPRYRKAGVRDVWVHSTFYGGSAGQITIVRPIGKYAELDQLPGLLQRGGLSADAAQKVNARRAALVSGNHRTVLRFVPDLSFGMAGRATN